MTEAFSQNVSKLFSELKLVADNLLFIYAEATEKPLKVASSLTVHVVMTSQPNLGGHKSGPHVVATIFLNRGGHNFCG